MTRRHRIGLRLLIAAHVVGWLGWWGINLHLGGTTPATFLGHPVGFTFASNLDIALLAVILLSGGVLAIIGFDALRARVIHASRVETSPPEPCPICGYDLRASPERCPECGTRRSRSG